MVVFRFDPVDRRLDRTNLRSWNSGGNDGVGLVRVGWWRVWPWALLFCFLSCLGLGKRDVRCLGSCRVTFWESSG
jgi:hypothetical protein